MKKLTIAIVLLLFYTLSFANNDLPHVTVFGTAITKVTPDISRWYLSIKNKGDKLDNVATQHTIIIEKVLHLLTNHNIEEKNIQTTRMNFGENIENKYSHPIKNGYFASTDISFTISGFEKYKPLWIELAGIENMTIESISYDNSKRIEHQNNTRKNALLAARDKAMALATTLGSTIGEPLVIEEDSPLHRYVGNNNLYANTAQMAADSPGRNQAISPGKISITMRVKVSFRLITIER